MSSTVPRQSAVVLHGPKDLRIEERPRWPPASGECQVEIQATGLCGSDRTLLRRLSCPLVISFCFFHSPLLHPWPQW